MEKAHSINGVSGRMFIVKNPGARADGCFDTQKWVSESRPIKGYGAGGVIKVTIRFDDECKNKHNSFSITADVVTERSRRLRDIEAGGCLHDDIAKVFPELAGLIQWHLFDSENGPMHYVANTMYHASNRADMRYAPGEACQWETRIRFGTFPVTFDFSRRFREYLKARTEFNKATPKTNPQHIAKFEPVAVPYVKTSGKDYDFEPHYTVTGDVCEKWHEAPFKNLREAQEFCEVINNYPMHFEVTPTAYAKEKPRNLDAARRCANWPEATDEQLIGDPETLKAALLARLPDMMTKFRKAIQDECGFMYVAPDNVTL